MKNIFFTVYLGFTLSVFGAESVLKKQKTIADVEVVEPILASYDDHFSDEVRLMIAQNLTSQDRWCTNFDLEKAKTFKKFGLTSKSTQSLLTDKDIFSHQSGAEIIYLNPKAWLLLNILEKNYVLNSIHNQKSEDTKTLICRRVSNNIQTSDTTLYHPLIDHAIKESDVEFFQDVQKMLNLKFQPPYTQDFFPHTVVAQPLQVDLSNRAFLTHEQRRNENYEYFRNSFSKPLNIEELLRHNKKVLDAFQIWRITAGGFATA